MFQTDSQGVTRRLPDPYRMERMTEVVRYASDTPCIPPAFIAKDVSTVLPPYGKPISE
ncbi:hypothetical protein [Limimaricola cinnabarinus]|uniref:hypothetical protein n=1 Tax=Limimaricola cinnabarinus TaxID=1125964 RepID=UPI002490A978|nr:hypothetical protein [Limimaricola cinnabarinus]